MFFLEKITEQGTETPPPFLQTALMHTVKEAKCELWLSFVLVKKPLVNFNPSQFGSCNVFIMSSSQTHEFVLLNLNKLLFSFCEAGTLIIM